MLNVLAGKMMENVEVKPVEFTNKETGEKEQRDVCSTSIYVWAGKGAKKDIPVKIEAWGDEAHELAKYKKGDTIQFVGKAKDMAYKPKGLDKELTVMGYDVKKIDHNKTILKEVNSMLQGYIDSGKEKAKAPEMPPPTPSM